MSQSVLFTRPFEHSLMNKSGIFEFRSKDKPHPERHDTVNDWCKYKMPLYT